MPRLTDQETPDFRAFWIQKINDNYLALLEISDLVLDYNNRLANRIEGLRRGLFLKFRVGRRHPSRATNANWNTNTLNTVTPRTPLNH